MNTLLDRTLTPDNAIDRTVQQRRYAALDWLEVTSTYGHYEDGVARVVTQGFWVMRALTTRSITDVGRHKDSFLHAH